MEKSTDDGARSTEQDRFEPRTIHLDDSSETEIIRKEVDGDSQTRRRGFMRREGSTKSSNYSNKATHVSDDEDARSSLMGQASTESDLRLHDEMKMGLG